MRYRFVRRLFMRPGTRAVPTFLLLFGLLTSPATTATARTETVAFLPGVLPEPKPSAQEPIVDPHGYDKPGRGLRLLSNWPAQDPDPPIDVLHYDLDLNFELGGFEIQGTATLTIEWGSDPDQTLRLDLTQCTATAVRDGLGSPLPFAQDATGIDITLPVIPNRHDIVTVAVDYEVVNTTSYTVGANASFTFTEPNGSRGWFPCHDVPWDKATLTLAGTCVGTETLVSNGALDSTVVAGAETTYYWREDHPLATYLMAAAVSNYAALSSPSPVTPMTWYVYPSHTVLALNAFSNVDAMIAFFDSTLVPWPFDKYTQVEGNFGGGMEHQTCTLMGQFIVTANKTYEWITAHELAHQWFGDLVTTADWRHIWLNEGFATFYEAVWQEDYYGEAVFEARMVNAEDITLDREATVGYHTLVDPPVDDLFSRLVYYKGCWVLRMLRDLMTRPIFDQAVTDYLTTYAFGNATTEGFQAIMEAHYGQSLQWYFDQWLYTGTGSPRLIYYPVFAQFGDTWLVQIDITQAQATPTVFRLPLEVKITTTAGEVLAGEWIDQAHQILTFEVADQPLSVELDPDNKLLGHPLLSGTAGLNPATPVAATLRAWPNPFTDRLEIAPPASAAGRTIEVFDARGRRVRSLGFAPHDRSLLWNGTDEAGRQVPAGVYFIRVQNSRDATRIVLLP